MSGMVTTPLGSFHRARLENFARISGALMGAAIGHAENSLRPKIIGAISSLAGDILFRSPFPVEREKFEVYPAEMIQKLDAFIILIQDDPEIMIVVLCITKICQFCISTPFSTHDEIKRNIYGSIGSLLSAYIGMKWKTFLPLGALGGKIFADITICGISKWQNRTNNSQIHSV